MKWIYNILIGLIERYGTRDVYELCDALEIEIREVEPNNIVLHGKDAFYMRYLNGNEIIFISKEVQIADKDFILKHELAHAILHPDINNSLNINLINWPKMEKEANYFAFNLSEVVFDEVDLYGMTMEQICCSLELPYDAVNQLVNL